MAPLHNVPLASGNLMKPFLLILSVVLFACNDNSTEIKSVDQDTTTAFINNDRSSNIINTDSSESIDTRRYVWLIDFENKTKRRNPEFKSEDLNVDTLIKGLNQLYPNVKLEKVKISGDTLFTKIVDSEYLGQRMGSSGAAFYITEVVINLTSIAKIKNVKIDFKEGSHAEPGTWNAKDFNDYKEVL